MINQQRKKRHQRVRKKISGTLKRPRLNVFRSNIHIYAQLIDDQSGTTIISASSLDLKNNPLPREMRPLEIANQIGLRLAQTAQQKGISEVVFDRGGYLYHGRIKALAEGARRGGLKF